MPRHTTAEQFAARSSDLMSIFAKIRSSQRIACLSRCRCSSKETVAHDPALSASSTAEAIEQLGTERRIMEGPSPCNDLISTMCGQGGLSSVETRLQWCSTSLGGHRLVCIMELRESTKREGPCFGEVEGDGAS
mmetsp:Transcript_55252/g.147482  ORF Transcript_55252/g.147482 Transcript_55252/m.147482 type:complete len:134 (-) Transcript_55252:622-1023(-)